MKIVRVLFWKKKSYIHVQYILVKLQLYGQTYCSCIILKFVHLTNMNP